MAQIRSYWRSIFPKIQAYRNPELVIPVFAIDEIHTKIQNLMLNIVRHFKNKSKLPFYIDVIISSGIFNAAIMSCEDADLRMKDKILMSVMKEIVWTKERYTGSDLNIFTLPTIKFEEMSNDYNSLSFDRFISFLKIYHKTVYIIHNIKLVCEIHTECL